MKQAVNKSQLSVMLKLMSVLFMGALILVGCAKQPDDDAQLKKLDHYFNML